MFLHPSLARQLRAIAGECAGTVNVTLGSGPLLLSDGPGLYANDMECEWLVEAAGPITVVFKTLRTERRNDGVTDYVRISDGTGDDAVHRVFDGLELPPAFSTNATRMTVKFHSDDSVRFSGFELELYSLVPGGTWVPASLATKGVPSRPAGLTIGPHGRVPPRLLAHLPLAQLTGHALYVPDGAICCLAPPNVLGCRGSAVHREAIHHPRLRIRD